MRSDGVTGAWAVQTLSFAAIGFTLAWLFGSAEMWRTIPLEYAMWVASAVSFAIGSFVRQRKEHCRGLRRSDP